MLIIVVGCARPSSELLLTVRQTVWPRPGLSRVIVRPQQLEVTVTTGNMNIFADYVKAIFEAVRKTGQGYSAFLRMGVLAQGGELGETIGSYIELLHDAHETDVDRALRCMPEAERHLICGDDTLPCPEGPRR